MKVLSLFDGISCGQLALQRANINVTEYYSSEIDKHAIKVTQANFPDTLQVGDVTEIHNVPFTVDLLLGGSPCFVKNTLITTINGLVPIQDIKVNDFVLTHKGHWKKVLKIGSTFTKTRILKGHSNLGIETTDEHPFYSSTKNNRNPVWTNAEFLNKNTLCANLFIKELRKSKEDYNFWYMIGRYTGDGWYRKTKRLHRKNSHTYQFIVCCGHHEFEYLKNKFDLFGYKYNFSKERTSYKFTVCSQELVSLVEPIGKGASNKKVHPLLFTECISNQKAFLDGYFESDGFVDSKTNSQKITTTSYNLLLGIQQLVFNVYKKPFTLVFNKVPETKIIEGRLVNQKCFYTGSFKLSNEKTQSIVDDNYIWTNKVKTNIQTNEIKQVFNLEIEDDNTYIANNIVVHNCQSFSSAGTQTGFDGASGLFYEYVRILNLVTPRYFLLENVKMKKEWKDIISEELGVEPILINSSLVSAQNRERYYWTNIPNVGQPLDLDINFRDISEDDYKFTAAMRGRRINPNQVSRSDYDLSIPIKQYIEYRSNNKTNCLTTVSKDNVLVKYQGHSRSLASEVDYRYLTVNEMELLQTLPINYTNSISDSQRVKTIGNGWTVDVIAHILRNIE